jgi:hypothetical protein
MHDSIDFGLPGPGEPADDQVLADRGRKRRLVGRAGIIVEP